MGGISFWQIAIVALLAVLFFGRGKISELMGDFGRGINSFKKGLKEDIDIAADKVEHTAERTVDAAKDAIDVTPNKDT